LLRKLEEYFSILPQEKQEEVIDFARHLASPGWLPKGTAPKEILDLAGTLPDPDAAELSRSIEEACEKVDGLVVETW
jgi:hypothetical protein